MFSRPFFSGLLILLAVVIVIIFHEMAIFMQLLIFEVALVFAFVIEKRQEAKNEGTALWGSIREGIYTLYGLILFFAAFYVPFAWAIRHWLA